MSNLTDVANTSSGDSSSSSSSSYFSSQLLPFDVFLELSLAIAIVTCFFVAFGIFSNIVNTIIFYRMGLNTTTNMCFFSLSIFDLLSVLYSCLIALNNLPVVPQDRMLISLREVCVLLSPFGHFSYGLGSFVTTIINLERSCAVVFPFKVKQIFTQKSVTIAIVIMAVYTVSTATIYYFSIGLSSYINPATNLTRVYIDPDKYKVELSSLASTISFTIPNYVCSAIVTVGTGFLIVRFKQSRKLQKKMVATSSSQKDTEEMSAKDARLIKAVILICIIYISGFSVGAAKHLASFIHPQLGMFDRRLGTIAATLTESRFLFQAIAGSVNIFVYHAMNTKYRAIFSTMFLRAK